MESDVTTWFTRTLAAAFNTAQARTAAEALRRCGIDPHHFSWLPHVSSAVYPLSHDDGTSWPDLESRHRKDKRVHGQFFTPETMVSHLLQTIDPLPCSGEFLDPACGAGGFLVPIARHLSAHQQGNFLTRLYGYDIDADALLVCLGRLLSLFPSRGVPCLEQRDFLLAPPERTFRLIIGNPPYRVNLPEVVREALKRRYTTAEGEKDLYTFFLEAGASALAADGELIMLTSHTYLVNHQCKNIRAFLFERHQAHGLYFLPFRFFPTAPGVLPLITHIRKSRSGSTALQVFDGYDAKAGWQTRHEADATVLKSLTGLARLRLSSAAGTLLTAMQDGHATLGQIARVGVGIQESLSRGRQVSRFVHSSKQCASDVPVLRGREIEQFKICWEGKFISYGPHLTYAGPEEIFRGPKILYQNLRNESIPVRLVATLDDRGFFPKNSLSYIAQPKPPFSLEYLTGLLNSPLVNAWFAGRYYSFHITVTQVRSIPIPEATPALRSAVEEVVREIGSVTENAANMQKLRSRLSDLVIRCYFPEISADEVRRTLNLDNPQKFSVRRTCLDRSL